MVASKAIEEEIKVNRRIISRLKREIFGVDKTHKSRYIREFNAEFRRYEALASAADVIEAASRSDIVYFGDYHPLEASQDWVLRLMKELSARKRPVVLALEMLYVHQQEALDRWMKGKSTEREFLDAIEYRSEWGFSWQSYRRIFELAKNPFVPIFGIDSEPRDHLKYIRRRDRLAAQRIGTIRTFFPDSLILVVVGESHLASNHLPREVHAVLGGGYRETVIVQNIDDICWRLLRAGRESAEAVAIDETRYCIFTTAPMLKYEAYRDIIDEWVEGDEMDRHTPFVHETIETIHSFFASGAASRLVELSNGRKERFDAVLPEVQCRTTYHAFSAYLRSRRTSPREIVSALENLKHQGVAYVPSINTFLIMRFEPAHAVREAARFVYHALTGELMMRSAKRLGALDRFFADVVAEAFVCFAAKILNPADDCTRDDALLAALEAGTVARPLRGRTMSETRALVRTVRLFVGRERANTGAAGAAKPLARILALGAKTRIDVARALGGLLGEGLHVSFHEGRIASAEIVSLFGARLDSRGAARDLYKTLLEKTDGPLIPRAGAGKRRSSRH